jgi:hypothetical protein
MKARSKEMDVQKELGAKSFMRNDYSLSLLTNDIGRKFPQMCSIMREIFFSIVEKARKEACNYQNFILTASVKSYSPSAQTHPQTPPPPPNCSKGRSSNILRSRNNVIIRVVYKAVNHVLVRQPRGRISN